MRVDIIDEQRLNEEGINNLLRNLLSRFYKKMARMLGVQADERVTIEILSENEFKDKLRVSDYGVTALCGYNGILSKPFHLNSLEHIRILKHELVHFVLLRNFACNTNWVQEGCAVYFTNQIKRFNLKIESVDEISVTELNERFQHNVEHYLVSGIYIKYLYEVQKDLFFKLLNNEIEISEFEDDAMRYYNLLTN